MSGEWRVQVSVRVQARDAWGLADHGLVYVVQDVI